MNVQGSKAEEQGLLNKSWKAQKAKVTAGDEGLVLQRGMVTSKHTQNMTLGAASEQPQHPHQTPLRQSPCPPQAGCTCGDLQKWRATLHCMADWQQSSEHNVVFWFPAQLLSHHSDFNQLQSTMVNKIQKVPPLAAISAKTELLLQI